MTFWLDAHLDPQLAAWLGATFKVIAKSLDEVGLRDADDETLFEAARRFREVVIVTKDHDFVELVLQRGAPPQVLWLSFGNVATVRLQAPGQVIRRCAGIAQKRRSTCRDRVACTARQPRPLHAAVFLRTWFSSQVGGGSDR